MTQLAIDIQAKAMELLQAGFGARFKTYRLTPMLQVQPGDLPILGVYILRERHLPHGSYNHAEPKFDTELTLGFSGGVHVETDKQDQLSQLENWMGELLEILLTNPKFVKLTEGMTGIDRVGQYATVGETTLYEIRLEMGTRYWTDYPPKVVDDLKTVHITTQFPDKEHVESGTEQIERVYDIETTP
ncbi:hypothetical protein HAP41_0000020560 [Bradyrhizobium barranii subsp. apii]|uniref:Uncharacterized protein n=1 Tax=Bradyrhizobium barranii subsp. apii TaxID=2819348 RepID=A0A8T5VIG5_9BRAD|nr:hypothetical protein [Bradyrhizobium barranii]UPT91104.1 hypothetical protein HAP41_0000020560 [Bradyrhizobium barranii subsp. apii]